MNYDNLMTNRDKDVFIPLVPSVLGAMLMSKVSRQKAGFREDLISLVDDDMLNLPDKNYYEQFKNSVVVANGFMEKWGVNYGHSSIKELDTLQMCIENKSRWFTEIIETVQPSCFMSYIEYSLRYNPPTKYYVPAEFDNEPELKKQYINFCDDAFAVYKEIEALFLELFKERYPELSAREQKLKAFENARNALPLSTLANMGMQSNLRAFCSALSELFAYQGLNAEITKAAEQMKAEAEKVSIGMVRHVEASEYQKSLIQSFHQRAEIAQPYQIYRAPVVSVDEALIGTDIASARIGDLGSMNRFDELPRAFKDIGKNVSVLLSESAHHQTIRHRMFNFDIQMPDVKYGMLLPPEVVKDENNSIAQAVAIKLGDLYKKSIDVYEMVYAKYPSLAPYTVLNCNMRELKFFGNIFAMSRFVTLRKEKHAQDEIQLVANDLHKAFLDVETRFAGLKLDRNL